MRIFRRWTTAVVSRVDSAVSRIENHDALVTAAIRAAQSAQARATVQLGRVRGDIQTMQRRCAELEEARERWKERAARVAGQDEERALECLRRRRRSEQERAQIEARLREHAAAEKKLSEDLRRIAERIEQLKQQRNLLRTRQSRAEALAAAQDPGGTLAGEIDDILERWETKITRSELESDSALATQDSFEAECNAEDEKAALRAELAELLGKSPEGQP